MFNFIIPFLPSFLHPNRALGWIGTRNRYWRFAFRFTPPRFSVFWVFSLGQSRQFVHNLQHPLKASDVLVRFHLSVMAFVAVSGIGAAQTSDLTMQGRYALAGLQLVHRQTLRLTGICVEVAG
jgi:hypothetical protein